MQSDRLFETPRDCATRFHAPPPSSQPSTSRPLCRLYPRELVACVQSETRFRFITDFGDTAFVLVRVCAEGELLGGSTQPRPTANPRCRPLPTRTR